jgi:hypothetical protein
MSLPIRTPSTPIRAFPFESRWQADALVEAASPRLAVARACRAGAMPAANADASPARAPARLHRYAPVVAAPLFRIR